MFKKFIRGLAGIVGVAAVALCVGFAVKMPAVYNDLFGITKDDDSTVAGIPYFVNFGDLETSDSSYKTQYFKYSNKSWYLSWGNHGSVNHANANDDFNMLLGWNSTKKPVYGGYSYVTEVMQTIDVPEGSNYSYLIMDFDFTLNHRMEWTFSAFENLSAPTTSVHLILSDNSGRSWGVKDTVTGEQLTKDNECTFSYVEDSLISKKVRYGLVLVSDSASARIELNQFIVQRLSVI